jgi:hypothetical protein
MMDKSIFSHYWKTYGGFNALFKSGYMWSAIILTLLLFPNWLKEPWWNDALSIVPGLLGFSLGGFAMWVAIGDEKFKSLIAGSDKLDEPSAFMEVNSTFAHFILLQIVSIIYSTLCKAYLLSHEVYSYLFSYIGIYLNLWGYFVYFIGYFLFIYCLTTAIATVFALYRISKWYDDMNSIEQKNEPSLAFKYLLLTS